MHEETAVVGSQQSESNRFSPGPLKRLFGHDRMLNGHLTAAVLQHSYLLQSIVTEFVFSASAITNCASAAALPLYCPHRAHEALQQCLPDLLLWSCSRLHVPSCMSSTLLICVLSAALLLLLFTMLGPQALRQCLPAPTVTVLQSLACS